MQIYHLSCKDLLKLVTMSTSENKVAPKRKIRPARKQVAVDQIDKTEQVQTGKEYSRSLDVNRA